LTEIPVLTRMDSLLTLFDENQQMDMKFTDEPPPCILFHLHLDLRGVNLVFPVAHPQKWDLRD